MNDHIRIKAPFVAAVFFAALVAAAAAGIACAMAAAPECVSDPVEEPCPYRTSILVAVGQTRTINPAFFDEGGRPALAPDNIGWQFGPASIGAVLPIFGTASAEIRGDAVGYGELRLVDLSTGDVLATADVCVFAPGPGTDAMRAELNVE